MSTNLGDIIIKLYNSTPLHRDNFLRLVQSGYYNGILFHRVINNFMIQAGDVSTRVPFCASGSDTIASYTIPSEIVHFLFHKKGAVAAARTGNEINPEIRSSGTQFYIVQGTLFTDNELDTAEENINRNLNQLLFIRLIKQISDSSRLAGLNLSESEVQEKATISMYDILSLKPSYKIPEEHRNIYKTFGGVPRLDQTYTVFGEVTEGIDIVEKIAGVETDNRDKPLSDIRIMNARIVKK
ncbi:MAG: peptidylprolyl isomerase [Bacteroidales bacterium]